MSARVGYGQAFVSREFRAILAAQSVSIAGTSIAGVALTILVYERTGSPFLSALTFALGFLPYVAVGGLLSGLVDRVHPRRLVNACDLGSGLIAAVMAWPGAPTGLLLGLQFCLGALSSLASGARTGLVRSTVDRSAYVPARSLMKLASQGAQIGGNVLGGALVVTVGVRGAILLNAASFLFAAAVVRLVVGDYPRAGDAGGGGLLRDSLRGARSILARAELRRLLLLGWLSPLFAVAPEALAAPYVSRHHGSATLVGVWLVAIPVGMIVGDVVGVRLLSSRWQRRLVMPAAAAEFVPFLAFAADPPVALALPLLFVSGICSMYSLGLEARVRDATPDRLFSRVMTLNSAGLMTLQGIGFALAGAVAGAIDPALAVTAAGICGLVVTTVLWRGEPRGRSSLSVDDVAPDVPFE